MKRLNQLFFLFVFLLIITVHGQEYTAIYIEQNIKTSGMNTPNGMDALTRSWITDQKVRLEQPGQVLLFLFNEKVIYTLMQKEQEYIAMSFADMDNLLSLSKMFMASDSRELTFKETGRKKDFNGWQAYEIAAKTDNQQFQIWLSTDIDIDREKLMKLYSRMPGLSVVAESFQQTMQFPGFPVLSDIEMKVMDTPFKTRVELKNIRKVSVTDSLFTVPDSYKQIENPMQNMQMK